jgi:hydrogenase expression/formation protein HypC
MCLAIPGIVKNIAGLDPLEKVGQVEFGGVVREISLACLPDVKIGDYVIAHAGVALQTLDEAEAKRIIADLEGLKELEVLEKLDP